MANVIVTYKVMPTGIETNLDELENEIKKIVKPDQIKREPMAFGLFFLKVIKIIPDASNESYKIESQLKKIRGVGEVDVTEITRTL